MSGARKIRALVPDRPLRAEMDAVPANVEVVSEPDPDVEWMFVDTPFRKRLAEWIPRLPGLRVAQAVSAGLDHLLPRIPAHVTLCSAVGVHDVAVSEWTLAAILAMRRRLPEFMALQARGVWDAEVDDDSGGMASPEGPIEDLEGARVLILGFGSIGRAVAARLRPFGAVVTGIARHARADAETLDALPNLLPAADVVVLLLPHTPETEQIVDAGFLARMKKGALLVNAARGRLVDTEALLAALREGRVRAALDVTDPEPLPPAHPLWHAPNVLVTPHVAGSVARWRARAYRFAGEQLRRYAAGEPLLNVWQRDEVVR
jgi:phosphoglycerate dehydrogenase-like enzyme